MTDNIFFDFDSKYLPSTINTKAFDLKKDDKGISFHWNLIKGNFNGIEFPVTFEIQSGKNFLDILDTGWPSLYLISDRLKTILEENKLTGWIAFPIKLFDKNHNLISGYYGLSVRGVCSQIDYEPCDIIEKRYVEHGPICKFYKGVPIKEWDGSDFFTPNGTFEILVSKKAADVLKKSKITNLTLVNLADKETNVDYIRKD